MAYDRRHDPFGIHFLRTNLRAIDEHRAPGETDAETRLRVFNIIAYHRRAFGPFRWLWRLLDW